VIGTVEFGKSSPLFRTRVEARRQHQGRHAVIVAELGLGGSYELLCLGLGKGHRGSANGHVCNYKSDQERSPFHSPSSRLRSGGAVSGETASGTSGLTCVKG